MFLHHVKKEAAFKLIFWTHPLFLKMLNISSLVWVSWMMHPSMQSWWTQQEESSSYQSVRIIKEYCAHPAYNIVSCYKMMNSPRSSPPHTHTHTHHFYTCITRVKYITQDPRVTNTTSPLGNSIPMTSQLHAINTPLCISGLQVPQRA